MKLFQSHNAYNIRFYINEETKKIEFVASGSTSQCKFLK